MGNTDHSAVTQNHPHPWTKQDFMFLIVGGLVFTVDGIELYIPGEPYLS